MSCIFHIIMDVSLNVDIKYIALRRNLAFLRNTDHLKAV